MNSYFWVHVLNIKIIGARKGHGFPLLLAILLPWQPRALVIAFSTMGGFTLLERPESSWERGWEIAGVCWELENVAATCYWTSFMHPAVSYLSCAGLGAASKAQSLVQKANPRISLSHTLTSARLNI